LLQGVRAGSPAEIAGLQTGDILTALGEIQIKNLYDLVFALRYYRAGDEVLVEWVRQGQKMSAKAILRARDGTR
jgi:S1-C subfamily serine protease